jgi:hypothetical protein
MIVFDIISEAEPKVQISYGKGKYAGFKWERLGNGDFRVTTPDGNTDIVDKNKGKQLRGMADNWIKEWEQRKIDAQNRKSEAQKKLARKRAKAYAQNFLKWGGRSFVVIRAFFMAAGIKKSWDEHVAWQEQHYYNFSIGAYGKTIEENYKNFRRTQQVAVGALLTDACAEISKAARDGYLVMKTIKNVRNMISAGTVAFTGFIGPAVIWVITEAAFWLFERWIGNVKNIRALMGGLYEDGISNVREQGIAGGYFKEAFLGAMGAVPQGFVDMAGADVSAKELMNLDPAADAAVDKAKSSGNLPDTSKSKINKKRTAPSQQSQQPAADLDSLVTF